MTHTEHDYNDYLTHKEGDPIPGLMFIPSLLGRENGKVANPAWDDKDSINPTKYRGHGYTPCVQDVIKNEMAHLGDKLKVIVEIGVENFNVPPPEGMKSYTETIIANKSPETYYIGVDKNSKMAVKDPLNRVHTIQTDSSIRENVYELMDELGIEKIDLLHIDGWHSVNQVVDDWKYTERLSDHGTVVMHDIVCHPGPWAVYEAIDPELYEKAKYCPGCYGSAVARRIQNPQLEIL